MAASFRLTEAADADLVGILRESRRRFGRGQQGRYAALILRAAELVAAEPQRPGSRARPEIGPGVRSFHIELAGRRRGAAAHRLCYIAMPDRADADVVILRILHERMDPQLHLDEPSG